MSPGGGFCHRLPAARLPLPSAGRPLPDDFLASAVLCSATRVYSPGHPGHGRHLPGQVGHGQDRRVRHLDAAAAGACGRPGGHNLSATPPGPRTRHTQALIQGSHRRVCTARLLGSAAGQMRPGAAADALVAGHQSFPSRPPAFAFGLGCAAPQALEALQSTPQVLGRTQTKSVMHPAWAGK